MTYEWIRRHRIAVLASVVLVGGAWLLGRAGSPDSVSRADLSPQNTTASDGISAIVPAVATVLNELYVRDAGSSVNAALMNSSGTPFRYEWEVNGSTVADGVRLAPRHFERGDDVRVHRVDATGTKTLLASTTIANAAPRIQSMSVQRPSDDPTVLRASVDARDPDGDVVQIEYRWSVNGSSISDADGAELPLSHVPRGQEAVVEARATDGIDASVWQRTRPLAAGNRAPSFDSVGTPVVEPDGEGGQRARLDLRFNDPDGDALRVDVEEAGVRYDAISSSLVWKVTDGTEEFDVTVKVSDEFGASAERQIRLRR